MKVNRDSNLCTTQEVEPDQWKAFKRGDQQAFSLIFRTYKDTLYSYGVTFFADQDLVSDCIQELFLEIWLKRENLADVHSIRYYLIKSLRRKLISKKNASKKLSFKEYFTDEAQEGQADPYEDEMMGELSRTEQSNYLANTVNGLPKRQKEAIYLRYYQKMSYEEIMSVMALSNKSVRNHICLAIQTLRKKLSPYQFREMLASSLLSVWFC